MASCFRTFQKQKKKVQHTRAQFRPRWRLITAKLIKQQMRRTQQQKFATILLCHQHRVFWPPLSNSASLCETRIVANRPPIWTIWFDEVVSSVNGHMLPLHSATIRCLFIRWPFWPSVYQTCAQRVPPTETYYGCESATNSGFQPSSPPGSPVWLCA